MRSAAERRGQLADLFHQPHERAVDAPGDVLLYVHLADQGLQVGQRDFLVFIGGDVDPGQPGHDAFGGVGGNLHLAAHGQHVGEEAVMGERGDVDFFGVHVFLRDIEQMAEVIQGVGNARYAGQVHGNGHEGISLRLGWGADAQQSRLPAWPVARCILAP